jgi:hypothetical protein
VVDGDGNDFAAGGDGANDLCIIDGAAEFVDGGTAFDGSAEIFGGSQAGADNFSNSCEIVYSAADFLNN